MVWTYDFTEDQVRASLPKETAAQTNFYSVRDEAGQYNDKLELWLADIENRAAEVYDQLLQGEIPMGDKRGHFAVFVAAGYARTPSMLRKAGETLGIGVQMMTKTITATPERFEKSLQEFEQARGSIDPKVRNTLYEFLKDPTRYEISIDHAVTLPSTLGLVEKLIDPLCKMSWTVIGSEDEHFITGDQPVTCTSYFMDKRALVSFPLSPVRCLLMSWTEDDLTGGITPARADQVRALNTQRAYFASRYLYANRRDEGIRALGHEHKESGLKMVVNGGADKWAPVTVRRRLSPRT